MSTFETTTHSLTSTSIRASNVSSSSPPLSDKDLEKVDSKLSVADEKATTTPCVTCGAHSPTNTIKVNTSPRRNSIPSSIIASINNTFNGNNNNNNNSDNTNIMSSNLPSLPLNQLSATLSRRTTSTSSNASTSSSATLTNLLQRSNTTGSNNANSNNNNNNATANNNTSATTAASSNGVISGYNMDNDDGFRYEISNTIIKEEDLEEAPLFVLVMTYLNYFVLILFGHVRDMFGKVFKSDEYKHLKHQNGYAPINADFADFYTRRLYRRIRDCWNRPITGVAGRTVQCLERVSQDQNKTFTLTGSVKECLNLSSYNYLGFAQSEGPCADAVEVAIKKYGVACSSARNESGNLDVHVELESLVAKFLNVEASMVVSMGFATNSTTIPALVSKGCLLISDELNHSSLVFGSRLSGAVIRTFKHNDMHDLEHVLREAISQGQPRTHRPWKKILVVVEGLYSMEGTFVNLRGIVDLKKKYKFYLYLDEAHSIGALGPNGRGVCDYFGVDTRDVDILMGTFTKSFGAAGGYVAGRKSLIDYLRLQCHGTAYAEAISPAVAQQIITSMSIIMGTDGTDEGKRRIQALARNCRFFSRELKKMGFIVYGHEHSPVVPLLLFQPCKIAAFSREMYARGIAVVVVGYPATPIIASRARFCISASHTIEDLKWALSKISEVGDRMMLKVSRRDWIKEFGEEGVELEDEKVKAH